MHHHLQIVSFIENGNCITVTYLNRNEPLIHSLYRCTFQQAEDHSYELSELLHYCLESEEFLDIRGLYSTTLEQSIMSSLESQIS
jgi:hypothetical protein